MKGNMKRAVEVSTRRIKIGKVEEAIQDLFPACYDEQKKEIKTAIINMVQGGLTEIVKQGRLDSIWVRCLYLLARSLRCYARSEAKNHRKYILYYSSRSVC